MALLFGLTLFAAAWLLFVVQPMIGKMMLPLLGGTPAVWNTCMLFFQAALLGGYAYAHLLTARLSRRKGMLVHGGLILLALASLPIAARSDEALTSGGAAHPAAWLLGQLSVTAGLPFFVVAATAPLLQRWFAGTGHPSARDPYFLYAASNLGSMLALLGYPFLVEPNLTLAAQSSGWAAGYGLLGLLVLGCGVAAARDARRAPPPPMEEAVDVRPRAKDWPAWVGLAFIPSSLLLGVTTFLTTDLAPFPLLWVVPLAIYLLTFILAFGSHTWLPHAWIVRLAAPSLVFLMVLLCLHANETGWVPVHLAVFFLAAMACHGELVRHRPRASRLTEFYLAMSLGGALGGLFNAIVAPLAFSWVAEYPLMLVVAATVAAGLAAGAGWRRPSLAELVLPVLLGVALLWLAPGLLDQLGLRSGRLGIILTYSLAGLIALGFWWRGRAVGLGLALAAMLLASQSDLNYEGVVRVQERNFFGVLRVADDATGEYRRLIHSGTLHGIQSLDPSRRDEPLSYYHRTGPFGQVFREWSASAAAGASRKVAAVGLGAGSLVSYATPEQDWTFFEIDPDVVRIAEDPALFTYLKDCRAGAWHVEIGDARLRLRRADDASFGLIVLDAFSSDAIPTHLLTREALAMERAKLAPGGLIAFHISNRFIDLAPVLGRLADDAGMAARVRADVHLAPGLMEQGKLGSIWLVMAADEASLGVLGRDPGWARPPSTAERVWTDDQSDIVRHLRLDLR
ncbi:spermidine synthase [Aquisphaera giovannonii]|uniref:spermidine synthase n=1 Tax=Aquisphaera giovannonii TaxID=406548 RepID=UPI0011DF7E2C|nr:fused MFS/spermidine synthase [Aquisphaera giovannonii]